MAILCIKTTTMGNYLGCWHTNRHSIPTRHTSSKQKVFLFLIGLQIFLPCTKDSLSLKEKRAGETDLISILKGLLTFKKAIGGTYEKNDKFVIFKQEKETGHEIR